MGLANRCAQLVPDEELRDKVFGMIVDEHERTHQDVLPRSLAPTTCSADNPALKRSVYNRFPYLEPLNLLADRTAPPVPRRRGLALHPPRHPAHDERPGHRARVTVDRDRRAWARWTGIQQPICVLSPHPRNLLQVNAGWSSSVARWAHNPEVAGSNPVLAMNQAWKLRLPGPERLKRILTTFHKVERVNAAVDAELAASTRETYARMSEPGARFTRVLWRNHPTSDRIGSRAISRIVQERANAAGFDEYLSPATHLNQPRHHGCGQRCLDRPHCRANMTPGLGPSSTTHPPSRAMATTTNRDLGL